MIIPTHSRLAALLLLVVCTICLPLSGQRTRTQAAPAFDKPAFEAYVRHLFVAGPDVALKISDPKPSAVPGMREVVVQISAQGQSFERRFFLSSDGRRIIQGTVYDLQDNPFRTELSKLNTDSLPSLGTPGAPVVLVLFTDFQCPFCRGEAVMLRQNLLQTYPKEVRLFLQDFPLEQLHPWAKLAAMAGRCIFRRSPAAFWAYHDWVFEQQDQITVENLRSKVLDFARGKEIDTLQLGRCLETKETEAEVNKSIAGARALELNATPTMFVNGRRIPSEQMPWQQLRLVIDNEIGYQKTAKNAGDRACCEVKLPSPSPK
jgi:protein-disulfide isomerase